jgi:hypothetical protein
VSEPTLLPCPCDCNCPHHVKHGAVLQEQIMEGEAKDIGSSRTTLGWQVVLPCGVRGPWGGNGGKYEARRLYNAMPRKR